MHSSAIERKLIKMPPAQYRANKKIVPLDLKENNTGGGPLLSQGTDSINNLIAIPVTTCVYTVIMLFTIIFFIMTFNYFNESPHTLIDEKLISLEASLKTIEAYTKTSYEKSNDLARVKLDLLKDRVYSNKCTKIKYGDFSPK